MLDLILRSQIDEQLSNTMAPARWDSARSYLVKVRFGLTTSEVYRSNFILDAAEWGGS
jgi:hypothetical protein